MKTSNYIQHPIQWVPGALSLGVKRPAREADHSPPSSAEIKNEWNCTSTSTIRLHGYVQYNLRRSKISYWCRTHSKELYLVLMTPILSV